MAPRKKTPPKNKGAAKASAISPRKSKPGFKQVIDGKVKHDALYNEISSKISFSKGQSGEWSQKRDLYHKMRMRMRKDKSFPFPGASNLRLPTLEKYIRKAKAALINLVWSQKPKATITAGPTGNPDAAFRLEYYLDYVVDFVIKPLKKLVVLTDKMNEQGFSFLEVLWKMEDERRTVEVNLNELPGEVVQALFSVEAGDDQVVELVAKLFDVDMSETVSAQNSESILKAVKKFREGETSVRVTLFDETYNNVDWLVHDAEHVHVPTDSLLNPQDARCISVETSEPFDVLLQKAADGIYDEWSVGEIDALKHVRPETIDAKNSPGELFRTTDATRDLREGIERLNSPSNTVKIYRTYAWHDLDGDGAEERCVFILAPQFKKILAKFQFPYDHKKWPVVRFDDEVIDNRWFSSRGKPELLEDIVKEIDTQHNQKIDQQTIRNTPMFTFRSGVINPRLVKFMPGQAIPVPGTIPLDDAISVMRNESTNAEFSYRDEEMLLKGEVQELVGQVDFSLQSQVNRREPRTASEVGAQQAAANTVFSLDAMIFGDSMSEVLLQTVQLIQQYAPNQVVFSVAGEGQTLALRRDEIQGQYLVRIRANDMVMSPGQRIQMANFRNAFLMQPHFLQTGVVTPQNLFFIAKRYLQDTGEAAWQQMVTPPAPPMPPGPPPAATMIQPNFADLTDAEKMQVLQSAGVQGDPEGRALAKQQEIASEVENENVGA